MSHFVLSFLGRIVEPKLGKVIGAWRKVCNEEHHHLYSSQKDYYGDRIRQQRCGQGMWYSCKRQNMQNSAQKTCRKEITQET